MELVRANSVICMMYFAVLIMTMQPKSSAASHSIPGSNNNNDYSNGESSSIPSYRFQYGVYDSQTNNDFGHEEERNGQETKGQYKVQLPDGRLQVVTYVADKNGYRAEVTYQGTSSNSAYSAPKNNNNNNNHNYGPPAAPASSSASSGSGYGPQGHGNSNAANTARNSRSFSTLKTKINGQYYGY